MADVLFKKKDDKIILDAKVEWEIDDNIVQSKLLLTQSDLIKSQKFDKLDFEEQMNYLKKDFFKTDLNIDESQLITQFIEILNYLKENIKDIIPSN